MNIIQDLIEIKKKFEPDSIQDQLYNKLISIVYDCASEQIEFDKFMTSYEKSQIVDKLYNKELMKLIEFLESLKDAEPCMFKMLLDHLQRGEQEFYTIKREVIKEHNSGMSDPSRLAAR